MGEAQEGEGVVIIVLALDTIVRILDPAGAASKSGSRRAPSPSTGSALSKSIIAALNKAKKDKTNLVGPLEPGEFATLSAWGRSAGLTKEAETVEAAVRASG